jgi:4-amino-4-deoxy-L-arabinose transferase-like glycosyltransferase
VNKPAAFVMVLSAALLASPWRGHIDDVDAQLYQCLARGMAERHAWLDPGLPPGSPSPYREHLPFGLWPYVAAVRVAGEGALRPLGALFSLLTVALVISMGWRLQSPSAGVAAGLILAVTETFFLYGGRPRLDPPLMLFATAAAWPALRSQPRLRDWALAAGLAAIAALIKGPFGLVPLASAAAARAIVDRSWRHLLSGALATLAAAAPAAAFLFFSDPSWWTGYVRSQLVASATGARPDGYISHWGAVRSVAARFWPGLPFAVLACLRRDRPRLLMLWCALSLLALSVPLRTWWNHELVAYPALALLAGAWLGPWFEKVKPAWFAALAGVGVAASAAGQGAHLLLPPCVASSDMKQYFDAIPPGTKIQIVSWPYDYRINTAIAAERRLAVSLEREVRDEGHWALAQEHLVPRETKWREVARARGYVLLSR